MDGDEAKLFIRGHRRRRSIWFGSILGLLGAAAVAIVVFGPRASSTRLEDGWCQQERDTPPVVPAFGLEPECVPNEPAGLGTVRAGCDRTNFELRAHKFGYSVTYWDRDSGKYVGSKEESDVNEYCDQRTWRVIRGDIPSDRDCDVHAIAREACGFP